MKLSPVLNITNILQAAFVPIFFCQKNKKAKLYVEKRFAKHFCMKKAPVKCWWNCHLICDGRHEPGQHPDEEDANGEAHGQADVHGLAVVLPDASGFEGKDDNNEDKE